MIWGYPHFRKPPYVSISFDDVYQFTSHKSGDDLGLVYGVYQGLQMFTTFSGVSGPKNEGTAPSLRPYFGMMFL